MLSNVCRFYSSGIDRPQKSGGQTRFFAAVLIFAALGLPVLCRAVAMEEAFEPYRVILNRKPFGEDPPPPPPPPDPPVQVAPPIRPEESFARHLRLTFIVRNDSGEIRIGIVNESIKKNYFMELGDTEDDITLVSIDYDQERVFLRHADQEAWLSMRGEDPETGRTGSLQPQRATTERPREAVSRYRRPPAPPIRPGLTREEYERTRAERPAPRPPRTTLETADALPEGSPAIPENLSPEEREIYLREYNLELIRAKGERGPPLPIQLTEEEDDLLVQEGVLPPPE